MQWFLKAVKINKNCAIFLIFAQNTDRGNTLDRIDVAFLTSTHNLCFRANIRRICYTLVQPSFIICKWMQGSLLYTPRICEHGVAAFKINIKNRNFFPREYGYIPC